MLGAQLVQKVLASFLLHLEENFIALLACQALLLVADDLKLAAFMTALCVVLVRAAIFCFQNLLTLLPGVVMALFTTMSPAFWVI